MFQLQRGLFRGSEYCGGALGYLPDEIYREVAYIAYHFSWDRSELLGMPHFERKQWVSEIARINKAINSNVENQLKAEKKQVP